MSVERAVWERSEWIVRYSLNRWFIAVKKRIIMNMDVIKIADVSMVEIKIHSACEWHYYVSKFIKTGKDVIKNVRTERVC